MGDARGRVKSQPLPDGGPGSAESSPGRNPTAMRLARIQTAEGWSGCRGSKALTGDATARRCNGAVRQGAEAAPPAGGIQQGAARLPLARWSGRRTDLVLDVVQNTSCGPRQATAARMPVLHRHARRAALAASLSLRSEALVKPQSGPSDQAESRRSANSQTWT